MWLLVGISVVIIAIFLVIAFSQRFRHPIRTFRKFRDDDTTYSFTLPASQNNGSSVIGMQSRSLDNRSIRFSEDSNFQLHQKRPTEYIPKVIRGHERNPQGRTNSGIGMV